MEQQSPVPTPGILSTKIPSTVLFSIGILLFFMPFAELKCNSSDAKTDMGGFNLNLGGQAAISNTGLGLAIGKEWKMEMYGLGGLFSGNNERMQKQPKQDPNYYAIAALVLGITGLFFCFSKKGGIWIAMLSGILSAAALIGLMFDLNRKVKDPSQLVEKNENTTDWFGEGIDKMKLDLDFTSWFYIAVLSMLTAAVFCYLRMKNSRAS
jgi:xanthine/uracil permease